jgi:hypothetical protein
MKANIKNYQKGKLQIKITVLHAIMYLLQGVSYVSERFMRLFRGHWVTLKKINSSKKNHANAF